MSKAPDLLRVQVDLRAKGKTLPEALAKLKDRREAVRERLKELGVPVHGRGLDFHDPWGNQIQVVDYREVQFTKTPEVLRAMDVDDLEKSESAKEELRAKGIST